MRAAGPPSELIVGIVDTAGIEGAVAGRLKEGYRGSNAVGESLKEGNEQIDTLGIICALVGVHGVVGGISKGESGVARSRPVTEGC